MSRTTVRYIQLPKLKSIWTSCRRAKARCQNLLVRNRPRRGDGPKKFEGGLSLAPQPQSPPRPTGEEPTAPETRR